MLLGGLTFVGKKGELIPCRSEGALAVPRTERSQALLVLRLIPKKSKVGNFVALNQRIEDLGKEIHRRTKAEQALQEAHTLLADRAKQLELLVEGRTLKLQETIGDLEAFSYTIAHDMRAPLRAMQNYSKILIEDHANQIGGDAKTYLERIAGSADRLDRLIHDVLNYSKIVRGDIPLEPVDTQALLDEIICSYPNLGPAHAQIMISPPLPKVRANRAGLTQAFSNLLGNAVKFVKIGVTPRILIRAECNGKIHTGNHVRLWFEDNGIGINKGAEKRLFQMFQRINRPEEYEGTGIGLAIVRKVVKRMGGEVGVESELGKGSRFWIELQEAEKINDL
jgi:signal transduction histidine kinase